MSEQFERSIKLFNGRAYGQKVSDYGLENRYLDYLALSKIVGDSILNNNIFAFAGYENWELENGLEENEYGDYHEIYQYYIVDYSGARFLTDYTDEIVYYHPTLDIYLWGITHWGTSWDYVLTDIKIYE